MVYLAAGAQELEKHRPGGGRCWVTYQAVDLTGLLPGQIPVMVTEARVEAHGVMCENIVYGSPYLVFFRNR
jgi:hypothetical protein